MSESSIKFDDKDDQFSEIRAQSASTFILMKPIKFVANTTKKLIVDKAVGTAVKITKKIGETATNLILDDSDAPNEEYLKEKNYFEVLSRIQPRILGPRILMGFMTIEQREALGVGLVDEMLNDTGIREVFKRKWLILISPKPIVPSLEEEDDEEFLHESKLPAGLQFDTIYFYNDDLSSAPPEFTISTKDIVGINVKDKKVGDDTYKWVIDTGGNKYFLQTTSLSERLKWLNGIDLSMRTSYEFEHAKVKPLKNINPIARLYDANAEEPQKVKQIIEDQFNRYGGKKLFKNFSDCQEFILASKNLSKEYLAVINACCAMKKKHYGLLENYATYFHGKMMEAWKEFFSIHRKALTNNQIFDICYFFSTYIEALKTFGEPFVDPRLSEAVILLARSLGHKLLHVNTFAINDILRTEVDSKPGVNAKLKAITCGPEKLWNLIQEVFNFCQKCRAPDFIDEMLNNCNEMLDYYTRGYKAILHNIPLSLEHYYAFCNSLQDHDKKCDQFVVSVKKVTGLTDEEIVKIFEKNEFKFANKESATICLIYIVRFWFSILGKEYKRNPLDLNIDLLLEQLGRLIKDALPKLREDFVTRVWKTSFEQLLHEYSMSLLKLQKMKDEQDLVVRAGKKIDEVIAAVSKFFIQSGKVDKHSLERGLKILHDFRDFLNCNPGMIMIYSKDLKTHYQGAVNSKTLVEFVDMRKDLTEGEKREAARFIREAIESLEVREERKEPVRASRPVFARKESDDMTVDIFQKLNNFDLLDITEVKEVVTKQDRRNTDTIKTKVAYIFLSIKPKNFVSSHLQENDNQEIEGYLDLHKDELLAAFASNFHPKAKWKTLFFSIKGYTLYVYKFHNTQKAESKFPLQLLESCDEISDNEFKIVFNDGRKMRLRAKNQADTTMWVDALNGISARALMQGKNEVDPLIVFYKDGSSLIDDVENYPDMDFDVKHLKLKEYNINEDAASLQDVIDPTIKRTKSRGESMHSTSGLSMENTKGKVHLSLIDADEKRSTPGCCAKFCMMLGLRSKPSSTDYHAM